MNNISNLSYLVKRLKDSGYETWKILDSYPEADPRKFTLLVDRTTANVFITCYSNLIEEGDHIFELHDGGQFIPFRFRIKTDSFEILVNHLTKFGIVQKYEKKIDKTNNG